MAEEFAPGVVVLGPLNPAYREILTPEAVAFVADLARRFGPRRMELLAKRAERQQLVSAGENFDFLPETKSIRDSDWTVGPIPADLTDRRTEITGPTDRKMVVNALNSGARCYMADFEDSAAPTWDVMVDGQINLRDAARGTIELIAPGGKEYRLKDKTATLIARTRGWHLPERHMVVDGQPVPGALFDFGLYFFHNAKALLTKGSGPYFYVPKLESHLEARLWNDVYNHAQDVLGLERGTIKCTALIETIPAVFEMDEILYELKDHITGLNCGRWDYIFSFIKKHHARPEFVLPERGQVTMQVPFLRAYSQLLIKTCHRRGAYAMGGMAAQIPIKGDQAANDAVLAKVFADKEREAMDGHDGAWAAHPGLVATVAAAFDKHMAGPNQLAKKREDVGVTAADLLSAPKGTISEAGLRDNIEVGLDYMEAWLRGVGCVPIKNLMEDAATAEISRSQLWQWVRHGARLDDGRTVTAEMVEAALAEQVAKAKAAFKAPGGDRYDLAAQLLREVSLGREFADFLTIKAYELI